MPSEKWCMIGKEYIYGKFMNKGKNPAYKGDIVEMAKKTMNKMNNIGVDAYCIYVRCNGKRVKPPNALAAEEQTYQKKGKDIIFYPATIVNIFL